MADLPNATASTAVENGKHRARVTSNVGVASQKDDFLATIEVVTRPGGWAAWTRAGDWGMRGPLRDTAAEAAQDRAAFVSALGRR